MNFLEVPNAYQHLIKEPEVSRILSVEMVNEDDYEMLKEQSGIMKHGVQGALRLSAYTVYNWSRFNDGRLALMARAIVGVAEYAGLHFPRAFSHVVFYPPTEE